MAEKYQSREERRKKQASKPAKKAKKPAKSMFKRIFLALIALGIVGMLVGAGAFAIMVKDAPKLDEKMLRDPIPSKILDKDQNLITEVGSERREYVEYEDIPKLVENAFLATEDVRFYKHHGMDLKRLAGAVLANFTRGFGSEGASTITQQVVKNSFLNNQKTLSRKAQEAWLAFQLERKYTKQEIFEIYVNKIWMSERSHGVLTASQVYFGKNLDQLTLPEAAMLAGLPQSPENYNPFKHPDRAEKRRNIVLSLMHQHGFITKEEMEAAQSVPVESSLVKEEDRKRDDSPYDSFVDVVIDEISKKYPDLDISSDGLTIYTTLDRNAQDYVEKVLNTDEIIQFPDEEFQAGITLLDTKTGEIRAIGGGRNLKVKRGFNFAQDTRRHAGSTFKPIIDYGPAIEYLKWGTYYTLDDKPYTYSNGVKINNWDRKHMGPMSMREALARSRNIPALQALQEVGPEKAKEFAHNLGFEDMENVLEAYSIGAYEVSPMQMAGAYSAFGNNGIYTEPHSITAIEMRDGSKIDVTPDSKPVMKDYTAFMITDMLKSVVKDAYGTGKLANVPNLHLAGKTGTTNYSGDEIRDWDIQSGGIPDAWFTGYTTNYTAAVWTGYKDRRNSIAPKDQKLAQLIFKNIMEHVSQGVETPDFTVPNSVEKVAIEKGSIPAKLAGEFTPKDQIIYEYAIKGNAPTEVSEKFDKLDAPNNLNVAYDVAANEILLTWEYPEEAENVQFEVSAALDDGASQLLQVIPEKGIKVASPVQGGIYKFTVTAVRDDQKSDPATVTIEIPSPETDQEYGDDNGQGNDEGIPNENGEGQGQGQGNGNGQGTGNGNGQGNDNGNGNDDDQSDTTPVVPPTGTPPNTGGQ